MNSIQHYLNSKRKKGSWPQSEYDFNKILIPQSSTICIIRDMKADT